MRFIWVFVAGVVAIGVWEIAAPQLSLPATAQAVPQSSVPISQSQITLSFAPVVRQAAPTVASIYARRVVERRANPFFFDPLFGQLFGDQGHRVPRVQNALGSGVIVSPDGIVVSNYHVVSGADDIRVVLEDRREFAADVILADEESDLVVLQMRGAHDLPAISLANSDAVEVGDLVLAIGNPFGVGQTVSSGIVSALARSGLAAGSGRGYFIQTDAAINPGNSGGALVDMAGHLVGINTVILTRSGGSNGIGFAIPANLVDQVVNQALQGHARFLRPWMGITGQAVDAALAEAFGMGLPQGVVISDMHPSSPMRRAGLGIGDVILAVDGEPVDSAQELMFRLSAQGVGGSADLTVLQGDARIAATVQLTVQLIAPPEIPERQTLSVTSLALRGLVAENINPAVIAENNLDANASGVLVVAAQDTAQLVGLRAGDRLISVNRQPIMNTRDLDRVLREPTQLWEVEFERDGRRSLLRFRL